MDRYLIKSKNRDLVELRKRFSCSSISQSKSGFEENVKVGDPAVENDSKPRTARRQSMRVMRKSICNDAIEKLSRITISKSQLSNNENIPPIKLLCEQDKVIIESDEMEDELGKKNLTPKDKVEVIPNTPNVKTPQTPFLSRLMKDLGSPSAFMRARALRNINLPPDELQKICPFDAPYEEQDIVTVEERNAPVRNVTIEDVMKDVTVYVEVRTGEDNRSAGIKNVIAKLGASVNDRLQRETTHVIFKDGLISTYNKAKRWGIPIVSVLWIEECRKQLRLVNPDDFPISNKNLYENPELFKKMRRPKSMQPDAENKIRRNKKIASQTKSPEKLRYHIPSKPADNMVGIFEMFKDQLTSTIDKDLADITTNKNNQFLERLKDSPYLNGIRRLKRGEEDLPLSSITRTALFREEPDVQLNATNEEKTVNNETVENQSDECDKSNKSVRRSRRLSMNIRADVNINMEKSKDLELGKRKRNESGFTPYKLTPIKEDKLSGSSTIDKYFHKSIHINETVKGQNVIMDISVNANATVTRTPPMSNSKPKFDRRKTNYNVSSIVETPVVTPKTKQAMNSPLLKSLHRRTMGTPRSLHNSPPKTPNIEEVTPINKTKSDDKLKFNSKRTPLGRRTMFELSRDVIDERLEEINSSFRNRSASENDLSKEIDLLENREPQNGLLIHSTPNLSKTKLMGNNLAQCQQMLKELMSNRKMNSITSDSGQKQETDTPVPKKRKLFNGNLSATINHSPSVSITPTDRKDVPKMIRSEPKRVTVKKPNERKPNEKRDSSGDFESPVKPGIKKTTPLISKVPVKPKKLVYTNMNRDQIEVIEKALKQLGGFELESDVTVNTTYLISPDEVKPTMNILRGLIRGVWILSYSWILESVQAGKWIPELEFYELRQFAPAVMLCRSRRQALGISYRMKIFDGLHVYISDIRNSNINRRELRELVILCNGRVVADPTCAQFVIGTEMVSHIYKAEGTVLPIVRPSWIYDSIRTFKLKSYEKYQVN